MTIKNIPDGARSRSDQAHSQSPQRLLFTQDRYGPAAQSAARIKATSGPLDGHHVSNVSMKSSAASDPSCPFQELLLPCPSHPSTLRLPSPERDREERHTILSFTITPSFGASVSSTFVPHLSLIFPSLYTLPLWSLVRSRSLQSLAAILCLVHQGRIFHHSKTNKTRPVPDWPTNRQRQGHFDCTAPAGDLL